MSNEHTSRCCVGHEYAFDKAWRAFLKRRAGLYEEKILSKDDFKCPHCGEVKVDKGFLKKINKLLDKVDIALDKSKCSTYRCETYNAAKGGARHSAHIYGKAIDIPVKSARKKRKLMDTAVDLVFQGIGVYNGHIHIDDRKRWHNTPVVWSGSSS